MTRPRLAACFDALGQARCQQLRLVSADAAPWIATVVAERCPKQGSAWTPSTSPEWATDALDQVRRVVWNAARKHGQTALARELKGARYALWKNPGDLTTRQRAKLARIAQVNDRLYRAYLLKEEPGAGGHAQGCAGHRAAPGVAGLGQALPHPRLRGAGQGDRPAPGRHPGHPHPRPVQRPRRGRQHQDPPAHPGRVRLQVARGAHRPGHAQPRRPVPIPARPRLTAPQRRATTSPLAVGTAPASTATACSRLTRTSVVEGLAR